MNPGLPPEFGTPKSAVVANPGALFDMPVIAAGLAEAGLLREYIAPFGGSEPRVLGALCWLLPSIERRIEQELRRRALPWTPTPGSVQHAAVMLETLFSLAHRLPALSFAHVPLMRLRNSQFDRQVARRLRRGDSALICAYSSGLNSLRRSRTLGIPSYLVYPIAHHRVAERILEEEATRVPDYADTLQFNSFPRTLRRRLESEIEIADRIFMLSSFHKQTFIEAGVEEEKLPMTPHGVDLELFRPGTTRAPDNTFRVIFVGQITQRKGISYLFDAFRRASIANGELLLVGRICGSSKVWSRLPRVRHVPHVPPWKLPELYRRADVFVLPSLVEGFPATALQAMACGLPVIVSENTFGSDVITDGVDGFVVPIRDAEAITERLLYLQSNPAERQKMGLAARQRALDFSWQAYADRVTSIISSGGGYRGPDRSNVARRRWLPRLSIGRQRESQ
jgi:alpha-maltose-1-phosphate synthase